MAGYFYARYPPPSVLVAQKSGTTAGRKEKHPAVVPSKE
jgi:hypothetical protein